MSELLDRILAGDRRAIARGLTLLESGQAEAIQIRRQLWMKTGQALRIGITGPPGVGKSTLVDALSELWIAAGKTVGILAVDPSSARTHGAILGDRIRMQRSTASDQVFMRSMAARGHLGGLAAATQDAADLLDAAGYSRILLETVGVGQSEIEVADAADLVILVLAPGAGDGIQAIKSGIMEIADLFVVNKVDLPGAEGVRSDIETSLDLAGIETSRRPPVILCNSVTRDGVSDTLRHLDELEQQRRLNDSFRIRREQILERRIRNEVFHRLRQRFTDLVFTTSKTFKEVVNHNLSWDDAVEECLCDLERKETS